MELKGKYRNIWIVKYAFLDHIGKKEGSRQKIEEKHVKKKICIKFQNSNKLVYIVLGVLKSFSHLLFSQLSWGGSATRKLGF